MERKPQAATTTTSRSNAFPIRPKFLRVSLSTVLRISSTSSTAQIRMTTHAMFVLPLGQFTLHQYKIPIKRKRAGSWGQKLGSLRIWGRQKLASAGKLEGSWKKLGSGLAFILLLLLFSQSDSRSHSEYLSIPEDFSLGQVFQSGKCIIARPDPIPLA